MKKLISMIIVGVMALSLLAVPTISASADSSGLVFSMDISAYSAENQVVKNGVTDSGENITIQKTIRNFSGERLGPALMTDYMSDGSTIQYLSFADRSIAYETTDYNRFLGAVKLEAALLTSLLSGNDEMTVEFWAKPYYDNDTFVAGKAFAYGKVYDKASMDVRFASATQTTLRPVRYYTDAEKTTEKFIDNKHAYNLPNDQWNYYAISRKWTADAADDTKGSWTYYIVCNGELKHNETAAEVYKYDTSDMWLTIGGERHQTSSLGVYNMFDGGIAEFNIYNKMLTDSELIANYNTQKAKYAGTAIEATNTMNCTNEESTANITAASGSYELTFDNYIDADTFADGIIMADSNGSHVAIAKELKEAGASKTAVVTYPALSAGTYTLSVNSALKSINGIAATAKTITLTAEEAKDYIFEEHFDYSNTAEDVLDETGLNSKLTLDVNNRGVSYKAETSQITEDKWITASNPTTGSADADLKVAFGSTGADYIKKTFAVDFALKTTGTAAGAPAIRFLNTSGNVNSNTVEGTFGTAQQLSSLKLQGLATQKDSTSTISAETDSNGFVTARFTFSRTPEGSFDVVVRNLNDSAADGISLIEATSTLTQVNGLYFKRYEKADSATSWSMSELSAYYAADYTVISHGLSADKATYDIVMSDTLNENYADGVSVTVDDNAVTAAVSGNTIQVPLAGLASGDHTVSLAGVLSARDVYCYETVSFTKQQDVSFTDGEGTPITGFNDSTATVKAVVTTSASAPVIFMAVYDDAGTMQRVARGTEISLDGLTAGDNWKIKCIGFDSVDSLRPLFITSEITLDYCL